MITKLSKLGDELVLKIDRSMIEQLSIDDNTPLELSIDGQSLILTPVRDEQRRERFEAALASTNERYSATLKRLAE
ncbi:MAG TPA: hypothetical protein VIK18_18875 [Pirellulales bacterium]